MRLFFKPNTRKMIIIVSVIVVVASGIFIWHQIDSNGKPDPGQLKPVAIGDYIAIYQNGLFNNFVATGRISSDGQEALVNAIDGKNQEAPYSGKFNIKATIGISPGSWGGWMFMRGYFEKSANQYGLDWGQHPDCGYDLTGAETLTFMARGATGGESVEFFIGGMGWKPELGETNAPYPDSTNKISSGVVNLTDEYQRYTIPLKNADLSYLSCGFGFVVSEDYNKNDVTIYLDDIKITPIPTGNTPDTGPPLELVIALISAIGGIIVVIISALGPPIAKHFFRRKEGEDGAVD